MSELADNEIIPCEEILFRAILKRKHLSNGKATEEAFLLRPQDEGKLSTWRRKLVSFAACKASYKTCHGVVTMHVGHTRLTGQENGIALEVVGDSLPDDPLPGHASVLNLPDPNSDRILAEWVATKLRDQSRLASE